MWVAVDETQRSTRSNSSSMRGAAFSLVARFQAKSHVIGYASGAETGAKS